MPCFWQDYLENPLVFQERYDIINVHLNIVRIRESGDDFNSYRCGGNR